MSQDVLERLRAWAEYAAGGRHPGVPAVRNEEAIAEIERLRELEERVRQWASEFIFLVDPGAMDALLALLDIPEAEGKGERP